LAAATKWETEMIEMPYFVVQLGLFLLVAMTLLLASLQVLLCLTWNPKQAVWLKRIAEEPIRPWESESEAGDNTRRISVH
jgi:hypothetical protein